MAKTARSSNQTLRCPCHSKLFSSKDEYNHHMADGPFASVGCERYQEWFDTLDLKKPLPKLYAPPQNYTLRRITQSHKIRTNDVNTSRQIMTSTSLRNSSKFSSQEYHRPSRNVPIKDVPTNMLRLHRMVQENGDIFDLLTYLITFGTPNQRDDLAPENLTQEVNVNIMTLYSGIDVDNDGRVEASELEAAAKAIGMIYDATTFRKIDKARTGYADILAVLRAFFPQHSMKKILSLQQKLSKPKAREQTTVELLDPEDLREIEETYKLYSSKSGGCTLANMMSVLSIHNKEHGDMVANLFKQYDANGDGVLTLLEFVEMVKQNYPPFKQRDTYMERLPPLDIKKYEGPLNKDKRVFETQLLHRRQQHKAYGAAEMLVVEARRSHGSKKQSLDKNAELLHVSPTVRSFASLRTTIETPH